jgi:hypothetical protein
MDIHNSKNCDCLECVKETIYDRHNSRARSMWEQSTDNLDGTADEFMNALLVAKQPVIVYKRPGSNPVKTIKVGEKVGVISGYVKDGNGVVWWQLPDYTFVKHVPGAFDADVIKQSLAEYNAKRQAEIDAKVSARKDANPFFSGAKSLLEFPEKIAKTIITILVVYLAVSLLIKFVK